MHECMPPKIRNLRHNQLVVHLLQKMEEEYAWDGSRPEDAFATDFSRQQAVRGLSQTYSKDELDRAMADVIPMFNERHPRQDPIDVIVEPLRVFTDIVSDIVADLSQAVGVYRGPGAGQEHRDGRGVITNDNFSLDTRRFSV
jgi:hypothetical protein